MKINFHSYANKTNFHMKNFALGLAFIMRFRAIRKNRLLAVSLVVYQACTGILVFPFVSNVFGIVKCNSEINFTCLPLSFFSNHWFDRSK